MQFTPVAVGSPPPMPRLPPFVSAPNETCEVDAPTLPAAPSQSFLLSKTRGIKARRVESNEQKGIKSLSVHSPGKQKPGIKKRMVNAGRGSGFSRQEIDGMLELLEEYLPIARQEWDSVLRLHMQRYPELDRTVDSLKRKFSSLHRAKVPTGDPTIPPDVKRAKQIRYSMMERADIGEAEDSDDANCVLNLVNENSDESDGDGRGDSDVGNSTRATVEHLETDPTSSFIPRPLVRKRAGKESSSTITSDLIAMYKLHMMQDQARREEELKERALAREAEQKWRMEQREDRIRMEKEREEERKERLREREEQKLIRAEEQKRHERLMELLVLSLTKK